MRGQGTRGAGSAGRSARAAGPPVGWATAHVVVVVPVLADERQKEECVVARVARRAHRVVEGAVAPHVHGVDDQEHALEADRARQPKVPASDEPRLDGRLARGAAQRRAPPPLARDLGGRVAEHDGREDGKVAGDGRADLLADARHRGVGDDVGDDRVAVGLRRHEKVVHRRGEPPVVPVEQVVRRARRLQVQHALVAEAVVQPVQKGPVRGRALHAPRGEDGEQPLERARRDEGVVRRPAVAPDEDADVAHEVDLEEDNRPARRRSGRHAEEREQPEQQQRRHRRSSGSTRLPTRAAFRAPASCHWPQCPSSRSRRRRGSGASRRGASDGSTRRALRRVLDARASCSASAACPVATRSAGHRAPRRWTDRRRRCPRGKATRSSGSRRRQSAFQRSSSQSARWRSPSR